MLEVVPDVVVGDGVMGVVGVTGEDDNVDNIRNSRTAALNSHPFVNVCKSIVERIVGKFWKCVEMNGSGWFDCCC